MAFQRNSNAQVGIPIPGRRQFIEQRPADLMPGEPGYVIRRVLESKFMRAILLDVAISIMAVFWWLALALLVEPPELRRYVGQVLCILALVFACYVVLRGVPWFIMLAEELLVALKRPRDLNNDGELGFMIYHRDQPAPTFGELLRQFTTTAVLEDDWTGRHWADQEIRGQRVSGVVYDTLIQAWELAGLLDGRGQRGHGKRGALLCEGVNEALEKVDALPDGLLGLTDITQVKRVLDEAIDVHSGRL